MIKDGKFRFTLQFGMNTDEEQKAGNLLEQLGKKKQMIIVSLEELQEEVIVDPADRFTYIERSLTDFDFEEEKLAAAFYELPLMRREVLRLLFAEQKTPEEISHQLHCSVNYVYLQKSRALRKLRADLEKGGNKHNKE